MSTTAFDEVTKIWSGPELDFQFDKYKNFGEFLLENLADTDSERVMQINGDTGESLTKAEVRRRTIQCAKNLIKFGCNSDQRIAVIARNHHNLIPLMFSCFCIGTPITALDIGILLDGLSPILRRLEPSFIFCDADVLLSVKNICTTIGLNVNLFTVNGSLQSHGFDALDVLMSGTATDFACKEIKDPFSYAALLSCSSGSTGLPKLICMSHALLFKSIVNGADSFEFVTLCFSSMYWFSGVWFAISAAFKNTRVFSMRPFSDDLFFDLATKYKIECFSGPPCEFQSVLKNDRCKSTDLSSLVGCILIGGHIPSILVELTKEILPQCGIFTGYGLTETGGGVTVSSPTAVEQYTGDVGSLSQGIFMKIIDESTNEKCGIGEKGEICIKLSIPSLGYFRDDEANRNAYDADGYFKTGDVGYFDDTGRLYISGRRKEIFKHRGHAIWPAEIENVLLKNSSIRNVCVTSIFDDELITEMPAALIVKQENRAITRDEVYAIVANQMAAYKRLEGGIYFVNELPMTASGKVIRSKCKEMAQKFYQINKNGNKPNINKL